MKWLCLVIVSLFVLGCANNSKNKKIVPSVSTAEVVKSLEETRVELKEAGESNTVVSKKIDSALSLAERLEKLLEEIEKETNTTKE
jgi:hypothetical protein